MPYGAHGPRLRCPKGSSGALRCPTVPMGPNYGAQTGSSGCPGGPTYVAPGGEGAVRGAREAFLLFGPTRVCQFLSQRGRVSLNSRRSVFRQSMASLNSKKACKWTRPRSDAFCSKLAMAQICAVPGGRQRFRVQNSRVGVRVHSAVTRRPEARTYHEGRREWPHKGSKGGGPATAVHEVRAKKPPPRSFFLYRARH